VIQPPRYDGCPQPKINLLETYACLVGRQEHSQRDELSMHPPGSVRHNSLLLGRACMSVLHHNGRAADKIFEHVKDTTGKYADASCTVTQRRQQRLHRIAAMLAGRNNPDIVHEQRIMLHDDVVREAAIRSEEYEEAWLRDHAGKANDILGRIPENLVVGLLDRYIHPWMTALPSLEQQDSNGAGDLRLRRHNYDVGLIETGPAQTTNNGHRLQVKVGCMGLCDEPMDNEKGDWTRRHYARGITLVSGHCDLGMRKIDDELWTSPLTELLVAENEGTATPEAIRTLDLATDKLLFDISLANPARMGIARPLIPQYTVAA
jgi:hypothetical protein